ncbi:sugar ABC transporter ATP-binding protein [Rahnella aquatilis]|jgi:simple sugar transport system ATP-binding protein|uniref:sugar ABC transporter ATP-binding protein n=1 Tax=Rahnella sp. RcJ3 TaxID=2292446 RepID=UPI000E65646F|nr:sugar ABC transporter ATP-binding protein [Rahnella sp. RcJ3]AYA07847.1 sugar ABC transporter ATP-binding protein [Rahnella aquatilis]AZP44591.1 sugar ABC transporter ATP-binding protein [Rahnella aquatilis]AZP48930.1 sugar ABC transporter ATP-binding protein [Rahnella aquatilis]AZP53360.1 sugar ABC transporter ATP-binding protein [Rahnella aquatilis]MQB51826.1 sugar ABC transporter ATP-binding protein [Rahnella sp. RcJ3]
MRNISISFAGFPALRQVDFTLEGGSVHALVGANGAGKSTLMAVLSGTHDHYSGQITIDGEAVNIRLPHHAREHGIHLVQQEVDVALVPTLNVAENIMLDRLSEPGHLHNWPQLYRQAQLLTEQLGLNISLRARIESCTLAEKQLILLARALSHKCRFLILDEPTAPLDQAESARLFALVRKLKAAGMAIVFISHRIHELRDICDRMTVLRDGRLVSDDSMDGLSNEHIIEKMIGHQLDDIYPPRRPPHSGETLLSIHGMHDKDKLRDISLRLHRGEILGIAGLAGAGKTELCKALFGATPSQVESGELNGKPWKPKEPHLSVEQGLALVPEERRKEGIFIDENIPMNLSVTADDTFSRWSIFNARQSLSWAKDIISRLGIRASGPMQKLARLSGGNQQKVAIGKWLRSESQVLIFDEPTKGVDIKAKTDVFRLIDGLAQQGKGIIYASGEFAELVGLCDRILVLWDGRIVAELNAADVDEETLLVYSTGGIPA